ncbi:unnamed protein product [Hyaloperonospora brassicae]|uniref:Uncharacterized protein n=1 Tax=Hyaloperonospora brassicae TaxID=162125 RepID=A0AAV0ULV8_HYABA|nr:unnamed protein product [Hyaloperonospora brassicae]
MNVVSELRPYASSAVQSLWRHRPRIATVQEMLQDKRQWLWQRWQHKLNTREASVALLPPHPHSVSPPLHAASTTESLGDIKTHLQLLHAALDDLQQKGERWDDNVGRLQGALRDVRTCCSAARDRCTACARPPPVAPSGRQSCNIQSKRAVARRGACPNTLLLLHVDRLDVPMDVAKLPTAVQDCSAALLDRLVKAVDDGSSLSSSSSKRQLHVPQVPSDINRFDSEGPGKQVQLEVQDGLNALQPQTKMGHSIARMYQVLARDD